MHRATLILAALAAVFLPAPAQPAKPLPGAGDPFTWQLQEGGAFSNEWVEQQSPPLTLAHGTVCTQGGQEFGSIGPAPDGGWCVWNQTGCEWTADDRTTVMNFGDVLAADTAVSYTQCAMADGFQHIAGISVLSPSPDLSVTVHYEPQGVTFTLPAHPTGSTYENRDCFVGPYYGDWLGLPEVPLSNNGHGLETTITITVGNPTGRRVRNVQAQYVLGSDEPNRRAIYCQGNDESETFGLGVGDPPPLWRRGISSP